MKAQPCLDINVHDSVYICVCKLLTTTVHAN